MADRVGFARSEEQTMLASTVREFLEAQGSLDTIRDASLTDAPFDRGVWDGLKEMGLLGLHVPEEYGGAGYSFVETAIVFEELGRRVVPTPFLSAVLAIEAILASGTEEQKAALIPSIASGDTVATLAVFESAHELETIDTEAVRSDGEWVVSGTKRFITDALNADLFVVSASTVDGVGLFAVDAGAPGLTVKSTPSLDATRPLGELALESVVVDADRYLGWAPKPQAIESALDLGVVALAQEQAAGAQRCLEMSVEYARSRFQFGRAIGSFQAVKHMCADMLVSTEHAKSAAWHAARSIGDAEEAQVAIPLAKSVCSDAYVKVAGDTIQVHGGIGFTWDHDAHLYFKRAKANALLLGSVEHYRRRLSDAVGI